MRQRYKSKSGRRCAEHLKYGSSFYFIHNFLIRYSELQQWNNDYGMQHLITALLLGFSFTTYPAYAITAQEFEAFVQSPKDLIVGLTATNYVSAVT